MQNFDGSIYVADAATARRNLEQNACGRWHKKGAVADQAGGQLAFQKLRQPLFTPLVRPAFKFTRDDKLFAIGSCFARGIEKALLGRKMQVLSAAIPRPKKNPAPPASNMASNPTRETVVLTDPVAPSISDAGLAMPIAPIDVPSRAFNGFQAML